MLIDSSKLHQQVFSDMFAQYENAKSWLEALGVKVSPTRFQHHINTIKRSFHRSSAQYDVEKDLSLLWAIAEIHDLLEIHRNLRDIRDARIVESLNKMVKGPAPLEYEGVDGGSIHGRNFTFELYVASRLARAGLALEFNTLADANFRVKNINIHLECKRVVSENNIGDLIASACKQIAIRCQNNPEDRGIAAVSVTKLVWKVLREQSLGIHAEPEKIRLAMTSFLELIGPEITKPFKRFNRHTIAILLHYKLPFRRNTDGAVVLANRFSMYSLCDADALEVPVLSAIDKALHDST